MHARAKALSLRKQGYSYTYISRETGLSKSMLSYYLKDLPYKPNKKTIQTIGKARVAAASTKARQKRKTLEDARIQAKREVGRLSARDMFMLGLGVYVGEGSKTQDIVRLVNADPRIINLFIEWLCQMGLTREHFVIRIHLYPESDVSEAEMYWSEQTGISRAQFQRAYIDKRVEKDRKRSGKYAYGTAHITVRSLGKKEYGTLLSRRIMALIDRVLLR